MNLKNHTGSLIRAIAAEAADNQEMPLGSLPWFGSELYDTRLNTIVTHAWETWTKNGLFLDEDEREETTKTVQDAANNAYFEGISDIDWLAATLNHLG